MSKNYSVEYLRELINRADPIIVELTDNSVYVGILDVGLGKGHYQIKPLTIHKNGMGFPRYMIKRIVFFNGVIVPKNKDGKYKHADILELDELVNKAGYEFF